MCVNPVVRTGRFHNDRASSLVNREIDMRMHAYLLAQFMHFDAYPRTTTKYARVELRELCPRQDDREYSNIKLALKDPSTVHSSV